MLTTQEKKNGNETKRLATIALAVGALLTALLPATTASARDADGAYVGVTVSHPVGPYGATLSHHLNVLGLFSAFAGDYRVAYEYADYDRPVVRHVDRHSHRAHVKRPHRHHDRCGHHQSNWRHAGPKVRHVAHHGPPHRGGKGAGHGKGYGKHKKNGHSHDKRHDKRHH
jgi:hypothetical protein